MKISTKEKPCNILGTQEGALCYFNACLYMSKQQEVPVTPKISGVANFSPAGLWDPACVLCPGWRGQLCHRMCSPRGPPNPALRWDHPPSSDNWRQKKTTLKCTVKQLSGLWRNGGTKHFFLNIYIIQLQKLWGWWWGCTWGSSWSCPQTVSEWGCLSEMLQKLHNKRSCKNTDVGEQEVYSHT